MSKPRENSTNSFFGILSDLFFDTEDGGDIFLRNVGLSRNCKEFQIRRTSNLTFLKRESAFTERDEYRTFSVKQVLQRANILQ
jgi:hypothetical protein